MTQHDIVPNPQNFAIWYDYHGGQNVDLRRAIDIIISNRRSFDDRTMQSLYAEFFAPSKEERALHDVSIRVQSSLQTVLNIVNKAAIAEPTSNRCAVNSSLTTLLGQLHGDAREITLHSEGLSRRLTQSAHTIKTLELTLDEVRRQASTDGLTNIPNRRAFDTILRDTAAEALNSGDPLSLLLIDIDHFKHFNDTWGHPTGDEVLRVVAATLRQSIRGRDTTARYGGEEFAVILPSTLLHEAVDVAHNIRNACARQTFTTCDLQQPTDLPTLSIGAACYDPGEPLSSWIGRADAALYRAKAAGRDRVLFHEAGLPG